jgi:hypothetical protein
MNQTSSRPTMLVDKHTWAMDQLRLLRLHDDKCLSSTPARIGFPLPNELLDIVLGHVIHDNTSSCHDIISFPLTCRACNRAEFRKCMYRTACFMPNPKSLAVLKDIAEDLARARLLKAVVYKDPAPRRVEAAAWEAADLSYRDHEFHRPCRHDRETDPCL